MRAAPAFGNASRCIRRARLLDPAAGVIVLFAAMPTGANAYIFAVQYQRLVNPVSGAVALGTLLAASDVAGGGVGGGEVRSRSRVPIILPLHAKVARLP